jgi:hypothetical protein
MRTSDPKLTLTLVLPDGSYADKVAVHHTPICGTNGPLRTFVDGAANGSKEPILHDAAPRSNGSNARQSGRSVSARYV